MDRNSEGMNSPKSKLTPKRLSAFEISTNLAFQDSQSLKRTNAPKAGDICPQCQSAKIDYDSMLNLSCPECGYTLAGCFT